MEKPRVATMLGELEELIMIHGYANGTFEKIVKIRTEIQEFTQEKSCLECSIVCVNGIDCDTARKTKEATGMKYSEMCFHCYMRTNII
jgi:aldehyde:ferredoxin oxidoreductase